MTEEEFVIEKFRTCFSDSKNEPIILYGMGRYTRSILQNCQEFNIIAVSGQGVIKGNDTFETKIIIPIESAGELAKRVVIIARRTFLKEIYDRISFIEAEGVKIYSIYKEELKKEDSLFFKGNAHLQSILKKFAYKDADYKLIEYFINTIKLNKIEIKEGKLQINRAEELGACFVGPLVLCFLSWTFQKLENREDAIIWFLSRDGYFIHRLYEKYRRRGGSGFEHLPIGKYVLASRRALSVISIENENDIKKVAQSRGTQGNMNKFLFNKFGIHDDGDEKVYDDKMQYILKNRQNIIENAKEEREHYFSYLKSNKLLQPHIFLFDLVTSGTSYRYARKIFSSVYEIDLICFQYLNCSNSFEDTKEYFWLGESNFYSKDSPFTYLYPICEIIFAPSDTMFKYFDEKGNPHFEKDISEIHKRQWDETICKVQNAAEKWLDEIYNTDSACFTKKYSTQLIEKMFSLLIPSYANVSERIKKSFSLDNTFENLDYVNIWEKSIDSFV